MSVVALPQPLPSLSDLWDSFWTLYPRHEAKKDASKAWSKLTDKEQYDSVVAINVWRQVWKIQGREAHLIPLPATWLRGERWWDEVPHGLLPKTDNESVAAIPQAPAHIPINRELPPSVLEAIAKAKAKLR